MSNGTLFPQRGHAAATKDKVWRKVVKSKSVVRTRESTSSDQVTLTKVWRLTLECGHVTFRPPALRRPPDKVVCKPCGKESK